MALKEFRTGRGTLKKVGGARWAGDAAITFSALLAPPPSPSDCGVTVGKRLKRFLPQWQWLTDYQHAKRSDKNSGSGILDRRFAGSGGSHSRSLRGAVARLFSRFGGKKAFRRFPDDPEFCRT